MKTTLVWLLCLLLQSGRTDFEGLLPLEGTWRMETKKGYLYESWKRIGRHELKSKSYKFNGQDTVLLERVSLKQENNEVFYIPIVEDQNNRQPVKFKLISVSDRKFTFENKEHDYPQRIIYTLVSKDSVVARIEGTTKTGQQGGSNYYFSRVK